jgi:hypothetical protein
MVGMSVGPVTVTTTSDGGHTPEFWAERVVSGLISISDTAPPEIRGQALAYREAMHQTVLAGMRRACLSDRTTVIAALRKAGLEDAANLVWKMGT